MARKRKLRKLAAIEASKKAKTSKVEAKSEPKKKVVEEPVVEAASEPASAPVVEAAEEPAVEEKPKKTRKFWSRKTTTEE